MRKLFLFIQFFVIANSVFSQYTVTKVVGKVKKNHNEIIHIGTKLTTTDSIFYSSINDQIRAISKQGTYTFSPSQTTRKDNNILLEILSSSIRLQAKVSSLSGRGKETLKESLESETTNLIISNTTVNKFLFDKDNYNLDNGNKFVLQITTNSKNILKILRTKNDTLLLYGFDFQTEEIGDSKKIIYTVGFYDKLKKSTTSIVTIQPYFDANNQMQAIIKSVISEKYTLSQDELKSTCYQEVYSTLGKPSIILFNAVYNKCINNNEIINPIVNNKNTGLVMDKIAYEKLPQLSKRLMRGNEDLPTKFSLRPYAPEVMSQGDFGSCTSWATAYAARTISWASKHNLNNIDNYDELNQNSFSAEFLYNHISDNNECNGSNIEKALTFLQTNGARIWDKSSFVCQNTYTENEEKEAEPYKIKDYQRYSDWFMVDDVAILNMKKALTEKKTLVIGIECPNSFQRINSNTQGIWNPTEQDYVDAINVKNNFKKYDGHALCIIGYNDNVNGGSFEIMNSWGNDFGENGFCWISYEDLKQFGATVCSLIDFEIPPIKEKLKIEANLEFILGVREQNNKLIFNTPMNVEKKNINTRGQDVTSDDDIPTNDIKYGNFKFTNQYTTGTKYKIKFNTKSSTYVYILSKNDNQNIDILFPNNNINESALIDGNNESLLLPDATHSITLTGNTGKERMLILNSKQEIDLESLSTLINNSNKNIYECVRDFFGKKLKELNADNFNGSNINYSCDVEEDSVIGFFVEIDHI